MDELHAQPAEPTRLGVEAEEMSTFALMREVTTKAAELMRKELELARSELRHDLRVQLGRLSAFAAAAGLGIATFALLLVAAVLALAIVMPAWGAALAVAGATAAATLLAVALGRRQRVEKPLARTRKTLEEDVEWARDRMS